MISTELQAPIAELLRQISSNVLLGAILAAVVAGLSAFLGAYLRKRGEDHAIRENFAAIREQLKTTTRDTEDIKQQLSGRAWRSQQQWSARERYYSKLLTQLHHFRMALADLSDYYMEPGSEHVSDNQQGEDFRKLRLGASSAYVELRKLLGPAAIFLSSQAVESLHKLFSEHWDLANFGAVCTADYVDGACKLVNAAYEQVLGEAKAQLGVDGDA